MTRQLSATTTVGHAIRSVRNNIGYAFRISWPWYTILFLVSLAAGFLAEYVTGGNTGAHPGRIFPIYMVVGLINILGFASIAVNWHRYILLDEVPHGSELFRLDDKTWRYFGNVLLITMIMSCFGFLIIVPVGIFLALWDNALGILLITAPIVLPFAVIVFMRLSVKLPAIALGRRDFSMQHAWAATRNNKLSIFLVILFQFLIGLGILVVLSLLVFGLVSMNATLGVIMGTVIQLIVGWVLSIFGITILTSLYGFFVEGRDF